MAFSRVSRPQPPSGGGRRRTTIQAAAEPLAKKVAEDGVLNRLGYAWQHEVWELYDRIPELRTAARITGQAMSQCRLVLARIGDGGEPVPLDVGTSEKPGPDADHPAILLLEKFAGGLGGQAALLDSLGVYLTTTGESVIAGKIDPTTADPSNDFDRLQAYSPEQIDNRGKTLLVRTDDMSRANKEVLVEDGYDAIRVWRPHPRYTWRPDSAAHSSLRVLREVAMYDDRIYANGISRLAGRGLLFVQEDIDLPSNVAEDEPREDGSEADPFMELLMEVMGLAISDPQSAAAMVPILIRCADPANAAKLVDFSTVFDEKILELRAAALARFAVAVDMPPEILTGFGSINHWTGALISEDWKNTYLQTLMGLVCGDLTSGWLLPALVAAGYGDTPNDVILWFDDSSVRTKENTGPEAQAAYDRGEISGDSFRRALGYDKGDAPSGEELLLQVAKRLLFANSPLAPLLMGKLGIAFSDEELAAAQRIADTSKALAPIGPAGSGTDVIGGSPDAKDSGSVAEAQVGQSPPVPPATSGPGG